MLVYKIVPRGLWDGSAGRGAFEGAPVDHADGYVHLSTAAQVRMTARLHFAGQGDLLLVSIDATALGPALRWEASRGGALFPHLYGPLPLDAVHAVVPLPLDADGVHRFPDELG